MLLLLLLLQNHLLAVPAVPKAGTCFTHFLRAESGARPEGAMSSSCSYLAGLSVMQL
jgi:hypothetical protein